MRLVTVLTATFLLAQQPPRPTVPLSIDDVVKLHQGGLSDELLITRIRKNGRAFDLSADELLELKNLGLSEAVINYLLDPSLPPYTPPPPPAAAPNRPDPPAAAPAPVVKPKDYPPDPYASRIPADAGVYIIRADQPVAIEIKVLMGVNEGAGLGKVLLKKAKIIGYLPGAGSRVRMPLTPPPVFYVRLPQGKPIEEVVLVALDAKKDRREIDIGPPGPKPEFKADAIRQFDRLEVGPQLFRATPAKLTRGEYLFYLLGSAEPPKGSYGKGYDIGLDEAKPAHQRPAK